MSTGIFQVPFPFNEPVKSYALGSKERESLLKTYEELYKKVIEIPQYIGNERVFSGDKINITPPHDHKHSVGIYHKGTAEDVQKAIRTALEARKTWASLSWEHRASIFLKAAELASGKYRDLLNASTMIGQSKNVFQAEIDSACELIDFLRFNTYFMSKIYTEQPNSSEGVWNRTEYRPLEGFTYAVTPFNFTAISMNLPASMALMGNVVIWKPSNKQIYSAKIIMDLLEEAGLPGGVINMVMTDPAETTKQILSHPDFSGVHFTGSTRVFNSFWTEIGNNINHYKTYPRIVGETGGKDFVLAHKSAEPSLLAVALVRGAFEYQGQKCSAASRAYIPKSLWSSVEEKMRFMLSEITVGSPQDTSHFVNAVIDENAYNKIKGYIDRANKAEDAKVIIGGQCDDSIGYFIRPTVILTENPHYESMIEEIFGPVLTVYLYEDEKWDTIFELIDTSTEYSLTGSVFSQDRYAIAQASEALKNSSGNFYINDKPTGAVVGQQPFGGARGSGTNDKAGSYMNLLRWTSARSIKETFAPPADYKYPFLT
ncbi:MAG: L-glutamate gamma-semialdehyde dehydrogenase [Flavobacteriaceae bacterium]|jgi:1-pyrroline-5-carboxylate dehydrogenase|nr:L-glutamate gamma-semialdehyde dehydrogenase [Flavobacteriaceae bacterium]